MNVKEVYIWRYQGTTLNTTFHSSLYTGGQPSLKTADLSGYGTGYEFILEYAPNLDDNHSGTNALNQYLGVDYQMCYNKYGFFAANT